MIDNTEFLKNLGENIKRIRKEKGISQVELASACNFEKPNMSRIEAGKTNLTISSLIKIANALSVEINELI